MFGAGRHYSHKIVKPWNWDDFDSAIACWRTSEAVARMAQKGSSGARAPSRIRRRRLVASPPPPE